MSKERELEINGHKFTITLGSVDTIERFDELTAAPNDEGEAAADGRGKPITGPRELCDRMRRKIELILGPDGYEKVFAGRPVNYLDHMELVNYLTLQLMDMSVAKEKALLGVNKDPDITDPVKPVLDEDDTGH